MLLAKIDIDLAKLGAALYKIKKHKGGKFMIPLNAMQVNLKKQERQMMDLLVAGQLWDLYEESKGKQDGIFPLLQKICAVGARISLKNLKIASIALSDIEEKKKTKEDQRERTRDNRLERHIKSVIEAEESVEIPKNESKSKRTAILNEKQYPSIASAFFKEYVDKFFFLDCFENNKDNVNEQRLEAMSNGQYEFTDMGKVGGYLRFHAELAERLCGFVCKKSGISDQKDAQNELRKRMKKDKNFSEKEKALYSILTREYRGRLFFQSKFTQSREDDSEGFFSPKHRVRKPLSETKEARNSYQQSIKKLDEENKGKVGKPIKKIPDMLRPFVKVPSHFDKKDYPWDMVGTTIWHQRKSDRMRMISQLYGLPRGAAISGTTADHMFGIHEIMQYCETKNSEKIDNTELGKIAEKMKLYKPFLYLVPLIQMVPQMHHSLAETAVALSLNGFIEYHVGYYTSLLISNEKEAIEASNNLYQKAMSILRSADHAVCHMYAAPDQKAGQERYREKGTIVKPTDVWGYKVDKKKDKEWLDHYNEALLSPNTFNKFMDLNLRVKAKGGFSETIFDIFYFAKKIDGNIRYGDTIEPKKTDKLPWEKRI